MEQKICVICKVLRDIILFQLVPGNTERSAICIKCRKDAKGKK